MLFASCHCGAIQIEMVYKPDSLTQCTCSICRRYAAYWAYCTRKTARVFCKSNTASMYAWGDKLLEFYHCKICGCLTHYESTDKSDAGRIAVNARMMSPADLAGIKIRIFDGAETWEYLDGLD